MQVCSGAKEWIDVMDCKETGAKIGKPLECSLDAKYNVFACHPRKDSK